MRKIFVVAMLFLLVATLLGPRSAAQAAAPVPGSPGAGLQNPPAKVDPAEFSTVVVVLRDQADVSRVAGENRAERAKNVVRALQDKANRTQPGLRGLLEARQARRMVLAYQPLWIINGFSVTASQAVIEELAQNPDVLAVLPDEIQIVSTGSYAAPEANIAAIQAPALWDMGFTGQGVVVANVDSGVDVSHPDLAARWRGGSNSWFDPYGQHPVTPTDMTGHGTWTMGILLGGDAGGTTIGVAPGAQWIAAKIFNDQGASTVTAIHQAYQWLLDPDGNPDTPDTPQVVNNSWSFANPGCNLTFEPDLQALVSAGILPVFAAGNGGPGSGTSYSPANNPSAFSVGAYDSNGVVWWMSSRGPSSCANSGAVFPDISAPGVDIYTSGLYGTYYLDSGTSFAAPHVAGGLALLLSAFPGLSAADQEAALVNGAVDLGTPGPDYNYGNGGLNLLAAYNWLAGAAPTTTPTLAPTDTPTPEPATATPIPTSTSAPSATPTASATATIAPSATPTATATATIAPSATRTPTATATATRTPTATATRTPTPTQTATATRTPTATATNAPSATPTFTPTATATIVPSATATATATSTSAPSATPTFTATATRTPTATATAAPSATPTFTATATTAPSATATVTATATASQTPTATATATSLNVMHVGDLDAAGVVSGSRWNATVTIRVHDANENPLANVTVYGKWTNGTSGSSSCVTNASGYCVVKKTRLSPMRLSVTFTVTSLSRSSFTFRSSTNHDPDGDSNGTSILISY